MASQDFLQAGITAAQDGDQEKARALLSEAVIREPKSEQAWLWLGLSLAEPDRRQYCFRRVLALNPNNAEAQRQLQSLGSSSPLTSPSSITPVDSKPSPSSPAWAVQIPVPQPTIPTRESPLPVVEPPRAMTSTTEPPRPERPMIESPHTATPPLTHRQPDTFGKVSAILIGILIAFLFCGAPALYLAFTGKLDPLVNSVVVVIQTPTPVSPTSIPTATPQPPTSTPSLIPTLTDQQKGQAIASDTAQAEALMKQEKYGEAIIYWDRVIVNKPTYGEPYYRRAKSYLKLMENQRSMTEFENYARRALADLDQAILLGPTTGDYYMDRGDAYNSLASMMSYRVDRDPLHSIALENYRQGLAMGGGNEISDTIIPAMLYQLGKCEEGLAETRRLPKPTESGLNTLFALGNLCLGKFDQALSQIDIAIKMNPNNVRKWYRAIILYNMGRLDDSRAQLNEIFELSPYYNGYRYYLRALIYYEQKKTDLAQQDLVFGAGQTWSHEGLASYVIGKIALDKGDKKTATEQMLIAEATLTRDYGLFLARIRKELTQLGVTSLSPTPAIKISVTPIPTPKAAITPLPAITSSGTAVPALKGTTRVDLATGTGPLILQPNAYPSFSFQPATPLQIKSVQFLKFHLNSGSNVGQTPLQLYLWNPGSGGWGMVNLKWGENLLANPERYVNSQGEVLIGIRNPSDQVIRVDNVGITLGVQKPDGTSVVHGLK